MINYSIIIPYRDTLELLKSAVASIPDRVDVQIIIVDNSLQPLASELIPQKQDAELLYTTSDPTMGAGRARNEGIRFVKGMWILFLDADDYFTPVAFDTFDKYLDSNYDIIYFDADSVRLIDGGLSTRNESIHQYIHDYLKSGNEDLLRYRFVNPISKMMKASFVINSAILFEEVKASNDMMFSIKTGHAAKLITADATPVYLITEGEKNTSLTRTHSKENQWARYQVYVRQYHFMESIGRKDLRFHLFPATMCAFTELGFGEGMRYLRYAWKERVNIFLK